ncbi:MAG: response regulator transcription factor [Campylobacterales bacterium]|nr:response regulator transcription factor [Campylobacterales bacterium]
MRALVLEDDYICNRVISEELQRLGFSVDTFFDGEAAVDAIHQRQHDFYLIDINVPNLNGYEVLRYIRERYPQTPALVISTHAEIQYLKKAFEAGCHDYLKKPFELEELVLRVYNVLRLSRSGQGSDMIDLSQGYSYSVVGGELFFHGSLLELTRIEILLLRIFVNHIGTIVTSEMMREYVWDDKEISPATIRYWVHRLMKKLKNGMIVNVRGMGYRLRKV